MPQECFPFLAMKSHWITILSTRQDYFVYAKMLIAASFDISLSTRLPFSQSCYPRKGQCQRGYLHVIDPLIEKILNVA